MPLPFRHALLGVLTAGLCAGLPGARAASAAPADAEAAAAAPAAPAPADVAEHALRDGLPSLALPAATNALAQATNAVERARAFTLVAAARERLTPAGELLDWLAAVPDAPAAPAAYFRARALSALGRHDEAADLLSGLRADLPADSPLLGPALRDLAYALTADGRPAEAAAALEPVRGDDPSLTLELGRLWLASGADERAEELLEPLAARTDEPDLAATAALLLARSAEDASAVSNALSVLSAARAAEERLPPDLRALVLSASAALASPGGGEPPPAAVDDARRAVLVAEGEQTRLECQAELLVLLARRSDPGEAFDLARRLVASANRMSLVPVAIRHAAAVMSDAGRSENALELCDLFAASFTDDPGERDVQRIRARALSDLGRHPEASAAQLRAAEISEASGDAAGRLSALYEAASEQHLAGLHRQAAATLDTLRAADPPPRIRAAADLLSAECLAAIDPAAATAAFLEVSTNHPAAPEASTALFRAAQLTAAAPAATNGNENLVRAIELFRRAAAPPPPQNAEGSAAAVPADEEAATAMQASSALSVALLQQRLGDYAASLASLEVAASSPGGGAASEQAAALRPATLLALGRDAEALGAYTVFTNAYPASRWMPDALFWRASRAFDTADYALAGALFSSFAVRYPGSPKASHALYCTAVSLYRTQRHADAIRTVESLAAAFPSSENLPPARFVQAEALCQLLEFDNAALVFAQVASGAATPRPLALQAAVRRADCLFALGGDAPARYRESLDAYRAALAAPECAEAGLAAECRYKIGRSLERLGDEDGALAQYYEQVVVPFEAEPSAADALWYSRAVFDAAAILRRRENGTEADRLLAKLAASDFPRAEEARRLLAPTDEAPHPSLPRPTP